MKSIDEILDRVHQGRATDDEIEYLKEQLSEEEIQERLELFEDLEDVFRWEETQSARHFVNEHLEQNHDQVPFWKWSGFWMAILLAVGIFLASYFLFFNKEQEISPEEAYAEYYAPLDMEIEPMTRGGNSTVSVFKIQELYLSGQYESVLSQSTSTDKDKIMLYRALSFMEVKKFAEAESTFNRIQSNTDMVLIKEIAEWYNALVSLKQNDLVEAKSRLNTIKSSKKHTYRDKASHLINSIDED